MTSLFTYFVLLFMIKRALMGKRNKFMISLHGDSWPAAVKTQLARRRVWKSKWEARSSPRQG